MFSPLLLWTFVFWPLAEDCTWCVGVLVPLVSGQNTTWTGDAFMQDIKVLAFQTQFGTLPPSSPLSPSLITLWQRELCVPLPLPDLAESSSGCLIIPSPGTINTCLPRGRWEVKAGRSPKAQVLTQTNNVDRWRQSPKSGIQPDQAHHWHRLREVTEDVFNCGLRSMCWQMTQIDPWQWLLWTVFSPP